MSNTAADTDALDTAFANAGARRPRPTKNNAGTDAGTNTNATDDPAALVIDVSKLGPPWLPNGYFTITFPFGDHRTLRVHTQQKGPFAGKRLISLLIGPDNTKDYEGFGFVFPAGVSIWKRFRNTKTGEYGQLLWELLKGEKLEGYSVATSTRCRVCNRPLTDAESIRVEVGPICRERTGFSGWDSGE